MHFHDGMVHVFSLSVWFQDGFDQAFVTPDSNGKLTESALLIDDDFALALAPWKTLKVFVFPTRLENKKHPFY